MKLGIWIARWYVARLVDLAAGTDDQRVYEELVEIERLLAKLTAA